MIREAVGYRIKEIRMNQANMTQVELANLLNWDRSYLSKVESGKQNISVETLYRICVIMGVSLKDFFYFMDQKHMEGLSI